MRDSTTGSIEAAIAEINEFRKNVVSDFAEDMANVQFIHGLTAGTDSSLAILRRHQQAAKHGDDEARRIDWNATTISKSGSTVSIDCDDADLANEVFAYLSTHPAQQEHDHA